MTLRRYRAVAGIVVAIASSAFGQTILLDNFNSGAATGAVRAGSTWVGNVTQNAATITIGGTARDDNGWAATGRTIDATGMSVITITGQRDAGHTAPSFAIQFEDRNLNTQVFSVATSAFTVGELTTVQIPITAWSSGFDPKSITSWSIGGGGVGTAAFRMTLDQLALSATSNSGAATAPVISGDFSARARAVGESLTLAISATGTAPLTYQWRKDSFAIAGATSATLAIASVTSLDAGSYTCAVSNAAGTTISNAINVTVSAPLATITLSGLASTYTGAPRFVTASTSPAGLAVAITYNGVATPPTAAGTYAVVGTIAAPGYSGRAEGTLVIARATQSIAIAPLPVALQIGTAFTVTGTATSGGALTVSVVNGNATVTGTTVTIGDAAPVTLRVAQAGDTNYLPATYDFTVTTTKQNQSIEFPVIAAPAAGATSLPLAATASSGLPVAFTVISGPAALAGATLTLTGSGTVVIRATQGGNGAFNAAPPVDRIVDVAAVIAPVALAGTWFGALGRDGAFALLVRENRSGVFLGYAGNPAVDFVSADFAVTEAGAFRFTAGTLEFDGAILSTGALAGTSNGPAPLAFSATKSAGDGPGRSVAGYYEAGAANSASRSHTIVATSGQVFVLITGGGRADGGTGALDSAGAVRVTTAARQSVAGTLDATAGAIALTATSTAGAATTFNGLSDNSPSAVRQRLVNLSTRTRAGSGDQVAIAGFVVAGDTPRQVLVRAIGPGLTGFGVTDALGAPRLELFRGQTLQATNVGWSTTGATADIAAAAERVGAFRLNAADADSALIATLAPGAYSAVVTPADARAGIGLIEVYDASPAALGQRLINLSVRANVGTGADTLIVGIVVDGTVPKRMLLRAIGPGLTPFGVGGTLGLPQLTVFSGTTEIVRNTGWSGSPDAAAIAAASAQAGAFPLAAGSADCALLLNLAPGAYSAQVSGVGGATGVALVEVYEAK